MLVLLTILRTYWVGDSQDLFHWSRSLVHLNLIKHYEGRPAEYFCPVVQLCYDSSNFLSKIFRINLRHSFEMLINKASRLSLKNWQTARILKFCVGTYVKLWVFHRKIVTKNLAKLNPFHVICLFLWRFQEV